jgi:hypothetical protein
MDIDEPAPETTDPFETLENIHHLLERERKLYNTIETMYASGSDNDEMDNIIAEINTISEDIKRLFRDIHNSYEVVASYNSHKKEELNEKIRQAKSMEKDLIDRKKIHLSNKTNNANKIREVEINTYYSSSYGAQSEIMMIIIIVCIPLVIISLLSKINIIPSNISDILMSIVILVGTGVIVFKVYDLTMRNNMNFDQYDWGTSHTSVPTDEYDISLNNVADKADEYLIPNSCVNGSCCSIGTYFDETTNQCLVGNNPIEGFSFMKNMNKPQTKSIIVPYNSTLINYANVNN